MKSIGGFRCLIVNLCIVFMVKVSDAKLKVTNCDVLQANVSLQHSNNLMALAETWCWHGCALSVSLCALCVVPVHLPYLLMTVLYPIGAVSMFTH